LATPCNGQQPTWQQRGLPTTKEKDTSKKHQASNLAQNVKPKQPLKSEHYHFKTRRSNHNIENIIWLDSKNQ
jgi:hypothetical protein